MKRLLVLPLLALAAAGCIVESGYRVVEVEASGLSSEDVVKMSKAGLSDAVLIDKIREDGVTAKPSAAQVESLKKEGVSDAVIAALLTAKVAEPERRVEYYPTYAYSYPYYPYYYGYSPYWYGSYWYGSPYYWGGRYGHYHGRYYSSYPARVSYYRR
jgi:hypothetical protein